MSSTDSVSPALKPPADLLEHVHSISRQSSVFLLGRLFTVTAGYLFKIYVARNLGAEALGIYTLGMMAGGLVSIVGGWGSADCLPLHGDLCKCRENTKAESVSVVRGAHAAGSGYARRLPDGGGQAVDRLPSLSHTGSRPVP